MNGQLQVEITSNRTKVSFRCIHMLNSVLQLNKALCRLKHAEKHGMTIFVEYYWIQDSVVKMRVVVFRKEGKAIYLLAYVDDIIMEGPDMSALKLLVN